MLKRLLDFTYDAYVDFIRLLKMKYRIVPFCQAEEAEAPFLILRHDVDASLRAALKMAKMEKKLGVKSTYFVLFSHKLYNLLEKDSMAALREISMLGHEIGLHYDVGTYEGYGQDLRETLQNEAQMLEHILGGKIHSVACHNVSLMTGQDPFREFKDYINVYDPRFCKSYVSDSCRAWFLKDLQSLLGFKFKEVQLLIHPFLWTEDACQRDEVLIGLFQDAQIKNEKYKLEWLRAWHESPKVKKYEKAILKEMRRR